jgi:hypothetical protein
MNYEVDEFNNVYFIYSKSPSMKVTFYSSAFEVIGEITKGVIEVKIFLSHYILKVVFLQSICLLVEICATLLLTI